MHPGPGVVVNAPQVPHALYGIWLNIVRGVGGLADNLEFCTSFSVRNGKFGLPEGPSPGPVQRLLVLIGYVDDNQQESKLLP